MLTECELIIKFQSSFQLLTFMVVIHKDKGTTMDFCMNEFVSFWASQKEMG